MFCYAMIPWCADKLSLVKPVHGTKEVVGLLIQSVEKLIQI